MALTRAQLQAQIPALPTEVVPVPDLGGDLVVRGMTLAARLELFAVEGNAARLIKALAHCVVDGDGQPIASEEEWDRIGAKLPAVALNLWEVIRRLSGLDVEAVAKN